MNSTTNTTDPFVSSQNLSNLSSTTIAPVVDNPLRIALPYLSSSVPALVANLVIFLVLLSDRKLLASSALIAGLSFAHLMLALNMCTGGALRITNPVLPGDRVTAMWCVGQVFHLAYPWAFLCSAIILCLVGVERLSAVAFPHWFRKWMSDRHTWRFVALAMLFPIPLLSVGIWQATLQSPTTHDCPQSMIFGKPYTAFGRMASAVGGTVAISLTLSALLIGTRRIRKLPLLSGEAGKIRRQIQLTRAMLSVSIIDFCLVVIPNLLSFIATVGNIKFLDSQFSANMNVAFCVNAIPAVFSYLIFNSQFRHAAFRLVRFRGGNGSNVVSPSNQAINQQQQRAYNTTSVQPSQAPATMQIGWK